MIMLTNAQSGKKFVIGDTKEIFKVSAKEDPDFPETKAVIEYNRLNQSTGKPAFDFIRETPEQVFGMLSSAK